MFGSRDKKPSNRLATVWQVPLPDHIVGIAWSADHSLVAFGLGGGPVHVHAATSGEQKFALTGHEFGLSAVEFHPTEPILATSGQDGKIRLWDMQFGQERAAFDGGSAWVERLAWSPDGQFLATAAGKKIRVWNWSTGEIHREFVAKSTVADLAWDPTGKSLAAAMYGGVRIHNLANGNVSEFKYAGSPLVLAWSPNGAMIAHGNQDSSVHFWYTNTGEELHMSGYENKIRELSWDFTGRFLATGGGPAVCIWDCAGKGPEGSTPKVLDHPAKVTATMWQRRGFLIASGDLHGRVCLWQPANRNPLIGALTFENTEVSCLSWSRNDQLLAVGSAAGVVGVFKVV